ncbi:MAG: hypothetical protein HC828_12200 [Blastochloris sp.]|nr:hypothetical protein [Blastochloris sp.]
MLRSRAHQPEGGIRVGQMGELAFNSVGHANAAATSSSSSQAAKSVRKAFTSFLSGWSVLPIGRSWLQRLWPATEAHERDLVAV